MTATAAQLLETVISTTSSGLDRGRLQFLQRSAGTTAERQFFGEMLAATDGAKPTAVYDNPTRRPVRQAAGKPLDAVDLAWIQRLPSDPAKVAPQDVTVLVGIASQTKLGTSEHRLVHAVLDPVQRYHAEQEARATVENMTRPLPRVPDSVIPALGDAIRREMPNLTEDESHNRALQQAKDAIAKRDATHADRLLDARARLAEVAESRTA